MRNKIDYKGHVLFFSVNIFVIVLTAMMPSVLFAAGGQSESSQRRAQQAREAKTMRELFDIRKLSHEQRSTEAVRLLKGESLEKSLNDLHGFYLYSSGELMMISNKIYFNEELIERMALQDIEAIMGNRRVLKLYKQLSQVGKKKASDLITKEIIYSLPVYEEVFERYLQVHADDFTKAAKSGQSHGFGFSSTAKNRITVREIRYKVLALCFLAAQLELDCSQALGKVVDVALEQFEHVSDRSLFCKRDGLDLRVYISICNKQLLGTAIAKAGLKGDKEAIKQSLGVKWTKKKLTAFDAKATESESRSYFMNHPKVDYSKGSFEVEFIEKISDEQFDYLLHNMNQ